MNRKTLYLNVLAATLLGAGTAHGATLDDAIRAQTRDASASILEESRTSLHARPFLLDVPGVEIGDIKLVESRSRSAGDHPRASLDVTANGIGEDLRRDLVVKALSSPGMFGVYRYMTETALKAAIIVAE